ncbi:ComEA family DNA-binding protein [Vibrio sp. F74]|uniref:ComEA family DNA-binding protein n=1 Tax=Vibrio sp. F74 TaxID=700020 RepID=UPI0035F5762E
MNPFTVFILATLYSYTALASASEPDIKSSTNPVLTEQVTSVVGDKYEGIEITVNINTGTIEELSTLLLGIGEKKAQLIIDYRYEHGPFQSAEDLMQVKGIGPSTIEKNSKRIRL